MWQFLWPTSPTQPLCSSYNFNHTSPKSKAALSHPLKVFPEDCFLSQGRAEGEIKWLKQSFDSTLKKKKILSLKLSKKLPLHSILFWRQLMGKCLSLFTVNKFIHYSYSRVHTTTRTCLLCLSELPALTWRYPSQALELHQGTSHKRWKMSQDQF